MAKATMRVIVVEHQPDVREGLAILIDNTDGFACVGSFGSMEDALFYMRPGAGDVALVSIDLPGMSGIDGIRLLREQYPSLRLIALTATDEDDRTDEALRAGASGCLARKAPPARLVAGLSAILNM